MFQQIGSPDITRTQAVGVKSLYQILMNRTIHCNVDLFANRLNTPLEQFISWLPDPEAIAHNALLHPLKGINGYAFPPFCLISQCLAKVQKEKSTILLVTPAGLAQPWYATILKLCIQNPILLPTLPHLLLSDKGDPHPLVNIEQFSSTSRLGCLRRSIQTMQLSEEAEDLIYNSWGKGTKASYNSAWKKWGSWCDRRGNDPFSAPVAQVLEFFTYLFYEGFQYRTINVHRSTISSVLPYVNNQTIGQHHLVKMLMKGILRGNTIYPNTRTHGIQIFF